MESSGDGQFNIRWDNYSTALLNFFRKSLELDKFVDVTLACEGQSVKCHRLILSACSTYLDGIIRDNPSPNLVIFLKDVKSWELRALVTFMYNGEVSIGQEQLQDLCNAAKALKIKGLGHDYDTTGFTNGNGDMGRLNEEYLGIGGEEIPLHLQYSYPDGGSSAHIENGHSHQQKAVLPADAANRQAEQIKRKILTEPQKLVKMPRLEQGSSIEGQLENEEGDSRMQVTTDVSSIKDEVDGAGGVGEDNAEMMDGDGGGEESEVCTKIVMKYGKEVKESVLCAMKSGLSIRQCSETYGIPRKTLSKWKRREEIREQGGEGGFETPILPPKQQPMGAPIDAAERAERLRQATELAMAGVTVRQAAAHLEIPRTTLCAYMKRRGLVAKRNYTGYGSANKLEQRSQGGSSSSEGSQSSGAETNGQGGGGGGNSSHFEDFPFLGISELMDEMGQASYEAEEDAVVEGEEDDSGK